MKLEVSFISVINLEIAHFWKMLMGLSQPELFTYLELEPLQNVPYLMECFLGFVSSSLSVALYF